MHTFKRCNLGFCSSELSEDNLQDIAMLLVGKQTVLSAQIPADIKVTVL